MRKLSPRASRHLRKGPLHALAWARTRGRFTWLLVAVLTLVTTGIVAQLGMRLARSPVIEARDALGEILMLNARAVLWGPGFVAVVMSSLHAWRRDREDGILELVRTAGHDPVRWIAARTWVLGLWLVGTWALSSVIVILAVLGTNADVATHGFLAGLVPAALFALVQSALLAVLGSVCLGPRSRPGGYLLLAFVLFLPELLAEWTRPWVGNDLTSLPALATGLAHAARPASFDAGRAATCTVLLLLVLGLLLAWLRRESEALS